MDSGPGCLDVRHSQIRHYPLLSALVFQDAQNYCQWCHQHRRLPPFRKQQGIIDSRVCRKQASLQKAVTDTVFSSLTFPGFSDVAQYWCVREKTEEEAAVFQGRREWRAALGCLFVPPPVSEGSVCAVPARLSSDLLGSRILTTRRADRGRGPAASLRFHLLPSVVYSDGTGFSPVGLTLHLWDAQHAIRAATLCWGWELCQTSVLENR